MGKSIKSLLWNTGSKISLYQLQLREGTLGTGHCDRDCSKQYTGSSQFWDWWYDLIMTRRDNFVIPTFASSAWGPLDLGGPGLCPPSLIGCDATAWKLWWNWTLGQLNPRTTEPSDNWTLGLVIMNLFRYLEFLWQGANAGIYKIWTEVKLSLCNKCNEELWLSPDDTVTIGTTDNYCRASSSLFNTNKTTTAQCTLSGWADHTNMPSYH